MLQAGQKLSRPSAILMNNMQELFCKDDSQISKYDKEGQLVTQFGKGHLVRPYGKFKRNCIQVPHVLYCVICVGLIGLNRSCNRWSQFL